MNPEEVLTREALTQPHRTVLDIKTFTEESQANTLSNALRDIMRKELLTIKQEAGKE